MSRIFLHGGGDHPESRAATFGFFAQATLAAGSGPIALVVAETDADERHAVMQAYRESFTAVGAPVDRIAPVFVTPDQPLTHAILAAIQPRGMFVCGGQTPLYHQSLCADRGWIAFLREANLLYGGTSAGSAIAATTAIIGGWRVQRGDQPRAALFHGAGEGLDFLTTVAGLGLVDGAIDVHASQWGTLLRLIHAVDLGMVPWGWAIDEDTMAIIDDNKVELVGRGQLYEVKPDAATGVTVKVFGAPAELVV